jgi:formylglycine-generating enzyme required for sulfatase activity
MSLGRRLPELTADLALLADLLDQGAPETLERARAIVDKAVRAICVEEGIERDTVETMLGKLVERKVIPPALATQVRAVRDRELTLEGDAVRALVGFLEWRVGSRAHLEYQPPTRKSRRPLVLALTAAIAGVGVLIAYFAWPRSTTGAIVGAEMVTIPGATFEMGSREDELVAALALCREVELRSDCPLDHEELAQEQPRTVMIAAFELDRHEVTVGDYVAWLDRQAPANHMVALPDVDHDPATGRFSVEPARARMPIVGVTWSNARAYCAAVDKRLPTEAEWELAARGALRRTFPWGSQPPRCDEVVFARDYRRPCDGAGAWRPGPALVATAPKDVTPEGVHDLGGNVSEWTADAGSNRPRCAGPCENPRIDGPPSSTRVLRGGNWSSWMSRLRSAARAAIEPEATRTNIGFRCAR